ncbi:DUF3019 domain-containing protein [Pseudoalteromonas sp. SSM20]|uniref:DUF3019 domain-containing protein n=1 Tax=Pseudoalteromonas sp. SSM20 TaxID=3139394 RepID=UPI003BAC7A5D
MLLEHFVALLFIPTAVLGPSLEVTPHTCIYEGKVPKCEMNVKVTASAPGNSSLCILIELPEFVPRCFNESKLSTNYHITLESTVNVILTNESGNILVQKKLVVGKLNPKNYRVRRRFGWGI